MSRSPIRPLLLVGAICGVDGALVGLLNILLDGSTWWRWLLAIGAAASTTTFLIMLRRSQRQSVTG